MLMGRGRAEIFIELISDGLPSKREYVSLILEFDSSASSTQGEYPS